MKTSLPKKPIHESPPVQDDIEIRRAKKDCGVPVRRVHRGMAIFAVIALLLNADAIHRGADRMAYGRARNAALMLSGPLANLARTLRLHLPRQWIEKIVHGED